MVGFGENEQSDYDAGDLPLTIDSSKEYTIMRDGKGFACRPENVRLGRIGRPPRCPTLFFFDPLPEEELPEWDGSDQAFA